MIKVFVFIVLYLAAGIMAVQNWRQHVVNKYAEKHGRDSEYLNFELTQNAMQDMHNELTSEDTETRRSFLFGVAVGILGIIVLWPITTPCALLISHINNDKLYEILFGTFDE